MNLAEILFLRKKQKNSALYMPYLTLGDPDFETSIEIANAMIEAGADILELGIPFSDPTADGPVIQKAMVRSMKHPNFSLNKIFEVTQKIHSQNPDIPLVYLTYFNPVFKYKKNENTFIGEAFFKKCEEIGIKALVIPDLPFDSYEFIEIYQSISKSNRNISIIPMIAPNTSEKRIKQILKYGNGFVYYITSLGVTGLRESLPENIKERANLIRKYTSIPIFAGFGINKPEQANELKSIFDGVIVGSLNHKIIEEELQQLDRIKEKIYKTTKNFVENLLYV